MIYILFYYKINFSYQSTQIKVINDINTLYISQATFQGSYYTVKFICRFYYI